MTLTLGTAAVHVDLMCRYCGEMSIEETGSVAKIYRLAPFNLRFPLRPYSAIKLQCWEPPNGFKHPRMIPNVVDPTYTGVLLVASIPSLTLLHSTRLLLCVCKSCTEGHKQH